MKKINSYRSGYLILKKDKVDCVPDFIKNNWSSLILNKYLVFYDNEIQVRNLLKGGVRIIILGDFFLPKRMNADVYLDKALSSDFYLHEMLYFAVGRFVLICERDSSLRVYHDAFSSRSVFYSSCMSAVGSHATLLAKTLDLKISVDAKEFMGSSFWQGRPVKYFPGNCSPWENIYILPPNNYLELNSLSISRYYFGYSRTENISLNQLDAILKDYFTDLFDFLLKDGFAFGLTGGSDNRLMLAYAYEILPVGSLHAYTMMASNVKKNETSSIDELVKLLNINHEYIDPININDYINSEYASPVKDATANFTGYRAIAAVENFMNKNNKKYLLYGHGGEIMRGFYKNNQSYAKSANSLELAKLYGDESEFSINKFEDFLKIFKYSEIEDEVLLGDMFYWEHRMASWSGASEMNIWSVVTNPFVGFNSRFIYEKFQSLKNDYKNIFIEILQNKKSILSEIKYY